METAVERANELLAAGGQRQIAHCTPHTLRHTYASILAEVNLPPGRAHVPARTHRPDAHDARRSAGHRHGRERRPDAEQAIGCTIAEAFTLSSGRGVLAPNRHPSEKRPPSSVDRASWKAQKRLRHADFSEAAERTRTLDPSQANGRCIDDPVRPSASTRRPVSRRLDARTPCARCRAVASARPGPPLCGRRGGGGRPPRGRTRRSR